MGCAGLFWICPSAVAGTASRRHGAGHNALLALLGHEPLQSCPWRTEREARAERTQEEEQKTGAAGGWAGISGGRGTGTQKGRCAERLPAPSFHTGKNLGAWGGAAVPGRSDSRSLWSCWFQFAEWISAVKPLPCPGIRLCLPVVLEISTSAGSETSYGRSPDPNVLTINWETPADALCARARFRQSTQRMWSCLFLPPPLVAVLTHAALPELCVPMLVGTKTPQPSCQSWQLVNRCGFVRAPVVLVLHC